MIFRILTLISLLVSGLALGADKPNFILILTDDLGFADLGCYGNRVNEPPHVDRLA